MHTPDYEKIIASLKSSNVMDIFNLIPGHVYWRDRDGRYLGCNQAQARAIGLSPQEVIGKTIDDLDSAEVAAEVKYHDLQVMQSGIAQIFDEANYLSAKIPLFDQNATVIGLLGLSFPLQAYQQKVEDSRYILEEIIAAMPGHIYWKDRQGLYLGCNDQQAIDVGLTSRRAVVGKDSYDVLPSISADVRRQIAENITSMDKDIMEQGISRTIEEVVPLQDGLECTYLSQKKPLRDRHGSVIGMLGISVDITERKHLEAELVKAKQVAETANRLKTDFILNLQHDMRTPITGISLLLRQILKSGDWEKCLRLIPHAIKASEELLAICNELIDFESLAEADKISSDEDFSLHACLESIRDLYMPIAIEKNLSFIWDIDNAVPENIVSDEYRIKKILLNLLGNAFKFTHTGEVRLSVSVESQIGSRYTLCFKISDTGEGIAKSSLPKIFDKFAKAHVDLGDRIYPGSGLGLYTVKCFVDELAGTINVSSEVGVGSCFTVMLSF